MARGIQLACERCNFSAELAERTPFTIDASGEPHPLPPESETIPDGYFADWLCGECRLPRRLLAAPEGGDPAPRCPTCGAALLPFVAAMRELAEASRSRAWLELATEQDARRRVATALESLAGLEEALRLGEQTTQGALDALVEVVTPRADDQRPADLAASVALGGLPGLIENAADLRAAELLLRQRLELSAAHLALLERWCADEQRLPGVPCPQCETGQLIHWPVWR
jgi:hypothetical protein